jgi:hypothetical protein
MVLVGGPIEHDGAGMAEPVTEVRRPSPQQRFEESGPGRWVISLVLAITLFSILVWIMPSSFLRSTLQPIVAPYVVVAGLTQSWQLFTPEPRQTSREIYAHIEYDDGSTSRWDLPGGDVIGPYRSYRWRKWADELRRDRNSDMWEPAARFIAALHATDGRAPTRVTLVRRWAPVPELGSGDVAEWDEYDFYVYDVEPAS